MRRIAYLPALILILASSLAAQKESSPAGTKETDSAAKSREMWQRRAREQTALMLEEKERLDAAGQALALARLTSIWWKADPERARKWEEEVFKLAGKAPMNESDDARLRRTLKLQFATTALMVIDRAAGERMIDVLLKQADEASPEMAMSERANLAGWVGVSSGDMAHKDPKFAYDLGIRAMDLGDPNVVQSLYSNLQLRSPELAAKFLEEAFRRARQSLDSGLIFNLLQLSFPSYGGTDPEARPSAEYGKAALQLLVIAVTRVPQNDAEKKSICNAAAMAPEFLKRLPPESAARVQQVVSECVTSEGKIYKDEVANAEVRAAASDEHADGNQQPGDLASHARAKMDTAIRKGQEENDPVRALEIIDGMSDDERKAVPMWASNRMMFATAAALAWQRKGDRAAVDRLVAGSPVDQAAGILLALSSSLKKDEQRPEALLYLTQARKLLEKASLKDAWPWLTMVQEYARLAPAESVQVLREAVTGINRLKPCDPKSKEPCPSATTILRPIGLPEKLLQEDFDMADAAIRELDSPEWRVMFRLGMVASSLRMAEAKTKP